MSCACAAASARQRSPEGDVEIARGQRLRKSMLAAPYSAYSEFLSRRRLF
jgi:hypothetical protein